MMNKQLAKNLPVIYSIWLSKASVPLGLGWEAAL